MKKKKEIILSANDAFAVYSLPGSDDHLLIKGPVANHLSEIGGFVIQRFDNNGKSPDFITALQVEENVPFIFEPIENCDQNETVQSRYIDYTEETIEAINAGKFEKVVLSRVKNVPRTDQSLYHFFSTLKNAYRNAFVFLYHVPGQGCWCGATPEVLLETKNKRYLTMALAGTQADLGQKMEMVVWGDKEVQEQAIIERYIEEVLDVANISFEKKGPVTTRAGQVFHILSTFYMPMAKDGLDLSEMLHPGPAICGLPKAEVMAWIKNKEDHCRNHYCGYIGPWNIHNIQSLFINLRSMRIYNDQFSLYLGGGITKDSDAMDEWEETELKAQTILAVIDKSTVE